MLPSLEHVIKKRHHNRRRLRFMALVLVVIAVVCVGWGLAWPLLTQERDWDAMRTWIAIAVGFASPAPLLWLLDAPLARALVPMPPNECPACRYDLTALVRRYLNLA